MSSSSHSIEVFYSYSRKDEKLLEKLIEYLAILKRQGIITSWYDRDIGAGSEWNEVIEGHLNSASIILLLVSSSFMASDYSFNVEVRRAMERHEKGEACVIPIILSPCLWQAAPFSKLQSLPRGSKPITDWANRNKAFLNVAEGIQKAAERLIERRRKFETQAALKESQSAERGDAALKEMDEREKATAPNAGKASPAKALLPPHKDVRYLSPAITSLLDKAAQSSPTAGRKTLIINRDLRASCPDGVPFVVEDKELSGRVIRNATAHNIRFKGCDLELLKLYDCKFRRVDFENSNLSWLVVYDSELDKVHLHDCDLTGALFVKAILNRKTIILSCKLEGVVFYASTFLGRTEKSARQEWPEARFQDCRFVSEK